MPVAVPSLEESSDFGWLFWLSLASLLMNFIACLGCCLYVAKWLRAPVLNDVHVSSPLPPLVPAADVAVQAAPAVEVTLLTLPVPLSNSGPALPGFADIEREEGYWFCPAGMCYHLKGACQTSIENERLFTLPPCPRCAAGIMPRIEPQVFYACTTSGNCSRYYHAAPTCPNDGPLVRKRMCLNCKVVARG